MIKYNKPREKNKKFTRQSKRNNGCESNSTHPCLGKNSKIRLCGRMRRKLWTLKMIEACGVLNKMT